MPADLLVNTICLRNRPDFTRHEIVRPKGQSHDNGAWGRKEETLDTLERCEFKPTNGANRSSALVSTFKGGSSFCHLS
jgi:hypothetical protein